MKANAATSVTTKHFACVAWSTETTSAVAKRDTRELENNATVSETTAAFYILSRIFSSRF